MATWAFEKVFYYMFSVGRQKLSNGHVDDWRTGVSSNVEVQWGERWTNTKATLSSSFHQAAPDQKEEMEMEEGLFTMQYNRMETVWPLWQDQGEGWTLFFSLLVVTDWLVVFLFSYRPPKLILELGSEKLEKGDLSHFANLLWAIHLFYYHAPNK